MRGSDLKRKLQAGGIVYGTMTGTSRNPRWASVFGAFGLDYIILDTEHSPMDRADIGDMIAALDNTGVVPIVRIPIPSSHYVTQALDAGAQGILAPYCETVDEVKEVVGAAKWRPLKGALLDKVLDTGQFPSAETKAYLENRNVDNVCIIGIESVPAIENLDAILSVDGIDGIFVGPNDMTISIGVPDQYDHPEYESALRTVISISNAHNTPVLIHHQTVELTTKWLREGARFVLFSTDTGQMHNSVRRDFGEVMAVGQELGGDVAVDAGESGEVI